MEPVSKGGDSGGVGGAGRFAEGEAGMSSSGAGDIKGNDSAEA